MIGMSNIGNRMEKKAFGALTGVTSGFTMGNEFNSLSKISIMCGTQFQEYAPFQDSPEDLTDELADTIGNICGNILGGLTSFASVLGNEKMFMQVFCVMSGKAIQAGAGIYDIKGLKKVVAGGAYLAKGIRSGVIAWLERFIPQNISNEVVIAVLGGEAKQEVKPWSITRFIQVESHWEHNLDILTNGSPQEDGTLKQIYKDGEYIENQKYWENVKYGISDMSYSGCEIIATYNALKALGEDVSAKTVVELIATYECNGAVLWGKFGTSPYTIGDYFKKEGYDVVTTFSQDTEIINNIGESCDTVIVNAYNDENDITAMIHTVSITKDEAGTYSVHNAYCNDGNGNYLAKDGYGTLQEAIDDISNEKPKSIYVIGISNQ